jgi:hypothetical protein
MKSELSIDIQKHVDNLAADYIEKISTMIEDDIENQYTTPGRMIHKMAWNKALSCIAEKINGANDKI